MFIAVYVIFQILQANHVVVPPLIFGLVVIGALIEGVIYSALLVVLIVGFILTLRRSNAQDDETRRWRQIRQAQKEIKRKG